MWINLHHTNGNKYQHYICRYKEENNHILYKEIESATLSLCRKVLTHWCKGGHRLVLTSGGGDYGSEA